MENKIKTYYEHSNIDCGQLIKAIYDNMDSINKARQRDCTFPDKYRYLNISVNNTNTKVETDYFIGLSRVDKDNAFIVSPKINKDGTEVDIVRMLHQCLSDDIVSKYMKNCFHIFFDEDPVITTKEEYNKLDIFIKNYFLNIVEKITMHGLMKNFIFNISEMDGTIKGKLLVNESIKTKLKSNVMTKHVCRTQQHIIDNTENRILKAILELIKNDKDITNSYSIIQYFSEVKTIKLNHNIFSNVKKKYYTKLYEEALYLAYIIFKVTDIVHCSNKEDEYLQYPYFINMPELFERYTETILREKYGSFLRVGYSRESKNNETGDIYLRPDFLVTNGEMKGILDCKYKRKYTSEYTKFSEIKEDMQQLSLYSYSKNILRKLNSNLEQTDMYILYPNINSNELIGEPTPLFKDIVNNFYKVAIKIPKIKGSNDTININIEDC